MACAKMLYGTTHSNMVLEVRGGGARERKLNASDDRGIDVVRDQIRNFAGTQKLFSNGIKLVVLDEADNMTNAAQFALRRSRHTEDD
jgi:replication factor C subunit 3